MAILKGHLKFTGRIGELLYYYVGNQIYVRTVFAGQRKRVMKDKRYELFRLYGTFFSQSSKIGSFVYKALGVKNEQKVYNKLVGEAQKFFKHTGMSGQQILEVMVEKYLNGLEVEVPRENEDGGRIYGLLVEKREKEEKERKEIVKEGCFVNEDGEICGVKEEVETREMARVLEKTEDRVEYENISEYSEKEVVMSAQAPRKKLRILKAAVKIRWKDNDMSLNKMKIDSEKHDENSMSHGSLNDTVVKEEKTLNSV
ncbi:MAG: hypothetical protein DI535_07585 [Citrobacter freundii]|nr:MAG: hypothetical protein DI535_07585 [Citrobacter freundii]